MSRKPVMTNVEFLALAILLDPGKSGSHYCRALYKYRYPRQAALRPNTRMGGPYFWFKGGMKSDRNGNWVPQYRYPGRLWESKPSIKARQDWRDKGNRRNGPTGSWNLTPAGVAKAQQALLALGVDLDFLIEMP